MIKISKNQVFCSATAALLLAACGKDKKETVYVTQPQTTPVATPAPAPDNKSKAPDAAASAELLAVEVVNMDQINNKNIPNSTQVQFRLKNSQGPVNGILYKCNVEVSGVAGTSVAKECTSPYTIQVPRDGQYTLSIYAAHDKSVTTGSPVQLNFAVGSGQMPLIPGAGQGGQFEQNQQRLVRTQVGDLFTVQTPVGYHTVYSASTFSRPGYLKFKMIDASANDSAAPYPLSCHSNQNISGQPLAQQQIFQKPIFEVAPSGASLPYCDMTPILNFNSPADPLYNPFRSMNMNTMSYNALALAADSTLSNQYQQSAQESLSQIFVNVFTNVTGVPSTQAQVPFVNELSQTVSRMQMSCGSQNIEYLGNVATFQGYFSWSVAVTPLFGCVSLRDNQTYVDIAAFPMDRVTSLVPSQSCGWNCWIGQNFANMRAAEIVVEIGPFNRAVLPISVAQDAQAMMVQHIRKLTP